MGEKEREFMKRTKRAFSTTSVMKEHDAELDRIIDSDVDSLSKMRRVLNQFNVTHSRLKEVQRWKSVSLDRR